MSTPQSTCSEICAATVEALRPWPLFLAADRVRVAVGRGGPFLIRYSKPEWPVVEGDDGAVLSLQVEPGLILYLLTIQLPKSVRERGYGGLLYERVIDLGRALGCVEVRQTPSGWTPRGETRESYLVRRGWEKLGNEVAWRLGKETGGVSPDLETPNSLGRSAAGRV